MKNLTDLLKKISLYVSSMVLALAATYFLGLAPLLQAQSDFPENPNFPNSSSDAQTASPAVNPTEMQTTEPVSATSTTASGLPAESSQPNTSVVPQVLPPVVPPVSRSNESLGSTLLFKHTNSYIGELSNPDRDPFRKPLYILELEEKSSKPQKSEASSIDERIEAIRRWPLREYKLVGIIWDVRNPKAMIVDPTNTMHLLKRNYRIGDKDGLISKISEGSVTVLQENVSVILEISGK